MMPEEHLTPARIVLMTLYLVLDDLDFDEVLAHAGIPAARLDDLDGMVSAQDVYRLLESCLILTRDPALGLHLGQEVGIEMLDIVGMMVANAPNFRTAIQLITEYSPLISTLARVELKEEGERARLILHLNEQLAALQMHSLAELCGAAFFCMARRLLDANFSFHTLRSRLAAPHWWEEYSAVFGEEVTLIFEAGEDSIEFDGYLLNLPLKRHSPGLYKQLRAQAARQLASQPKLESIVCSVRRLIDDLLGERLLDLPTIAEHMGLTPRTLQRRLQEAGSSFQMVYDTARRERARRCLTEEDGIDINTLAALLGYSEPATFYRAFRGWFGTSPGEYRRRQA